MIFRALLVAPIWSTAYYLHGWYRLIKGAKR